MDSFEAYQHYLALKLHFGGEYDYYKYNAKTNASLQAFEKRKDKYQFVRLSSKLSDPEILEYYLANFIRGVEWIGDFNRKNWTAHKKINQSLEYVYSNDLEKLLTPAENFDILFNSTEGKHPRIVKSFLGNKITLETLVILERLLRFREVFDIKIQEKFVWPELSKLIQNYEPFLKVPANKFRLITLDKVKELTDYE